MGVKDLWSVLSPVCEKRSLWELENKVIAIDLSAWICDSQCLNKQPQINMYLRNLFFRTSYLLLLGVKPVFVLDGKAPNVKVKTIQNRLKSTKNIDDNENVNKVVRRSRLKSLQKQCTELLSYMGATFVEAPGEAEAFCSHLNEQGLVDGVVTQDSDAFLYGAREVYRNFQMAPKFTYDAYSMDIIESKLGLSRTKLIGFSLLSGSDYSSGVHSVGKETALKFLSSIPDGKVFERFHQWKYSSIYTSLSGQKLTKDLEIELTIRNKALKDSTFPNQEVINEFTSHPGPLNIHYSWKKPQIQNFIMLAVKKLMWEEEYAIKKMVPLVGRWHLENGGLDCGIKISSIDVAHGKSDHYKVKWNLMDVVTIERKNLVEEAYSELVVDFEGRRKTKVKASERKTQKKERKKVIGEMVMAMEKVPTKTLVDYLIPKQPHFNMMSSQDYMEDVLDSDDSNYLNLSGIIKDIVTRPDANPALTKISDFIS